MDRTFGPPWHCIVGKGFGSAVSYINRHFIFLYIANKAVLLYKYWIQKSQAMIFISDLIIHFEEADKVGIKWRWFWVKEEEFMIVK